MDTFTLTAKVPAQDFVENLLGSAFETCPWWQDVTYADGYEWDTHPSDRDLPFLTLVVDDPMDEDETVTKQVSVNDLVKAYSALVTKGYELDWEDHDAYSADGVIQQAVFGEVVYG
jgi:hypothetical protein